MQGDARKGWAEECRRMAEAGDDKLIDEWPPTNWDLTEWEWDDEDQC